jgi:hypothetical protein
MADQSAAVVEAVAWYRETGAHDEAVKAHLAILASQLDRGISLDMEEQELLRLILHKRANQGGAGKALETAFFKIYGVWPVDPPWWKGRLRMIT